jgi:hypothetical protein
VGSNPASPTEITLCEEPLAMVEKCSGAKKLTQLLPDSMRNVLKIPTKEWGTEEVFFLESHEPRKSLARAYLLMLSATLVLTGCTTSPAPIGSSPNDQNSQEETSDVESETVEVESANGNGQTDNLVSIREPLEIEVFVASDVDDSVREIIEQSLNLAAEEWGLYWPVEYWVLGLDEQAAENLAINFCQRREDRGDQTFDECFRRQGQGLMWYHSQNEKVMATGEPKGDMGRNGAAEWGVHWYASTLPWGLTYHFPGMNGESDVETVYHEYWHAVQASHISTLDWDARQELMGPLWFVEGTAIFMAHFLAETARIDGRMPEVRRDWPYTYEFAMTDYLERTKRHMLGPCAERLLVSIVEYDDECNPFGKDLGTWGIAYLVAKTSDDVLLTDFLPVVEPLGFEGAFEQAFGLTLQEFNDEFMEFFKASSDSEKLSMLPRP